MNPFFKKVLKEMERQPFHGILGAEPAVRSKPVIHPEVRCLEPHPLLARHPCELLYGTIVRNGIREHKGRDQLLAIAQFTTPCEGH